MTRTEALEIARETYKAHRAYCIANLFGRTPSVDELETFGYRHGWYRVGEFCFSQETITGQAYDHTQGGWAYL